MKSWLVIVVIIALLVLVGWLQSLGYFEFDWKPLTILFAALAGPFKMLTKFFSSKGNQLQDISRVHEQERIAEKEYANRLDNEIELRKGRIQLLEKDVELLDARIETLEIRKAAVGIEVKNMTADQKKKQFIELFGQ